MAHVSVKKNKQKRKKKGNMKGAVCFAENLMHTEVKIVEIAIPLDYEKGKSTESLFEYKMEKAQTFIGKHAWGEI